MKSIFASIHVCERTNLHLYVSVNMRICVYMRMCVYRLVGKMQRDEDYMQRATFVGERGRETTAPNPWVGCVIVNGSTGEIVAEGFHVFKGGPHAERVALSNLSLGAQFCTMYVTLEPCCHFGSTPPCVDAIISMGFPRVVVGILDPDENVSGRGIERLQGAGICVDVGVCRSKVEESLRPYLFHRKNLGRPWVVAKLGTSMNGLIAYSDGTSQWITSEASRSLGMQIRRRSQAILVGVTTVLKDNPHLTKRGGTVVASTPFFRVVVDPIAKLAAVEDYTKFNVLSDSCGNTLIYCLDTHLPKSSFGQEVWIGMKSICLSTILADLGNRGVLQLLVEGGSTTISKFMQRVNELTLFIAPRLIGHGGLPFYNSQQPGTITDHQEEWNLVSALPVENGDGDVFIHYVRHCT